MDMMKKKAGIIALCSTLIVLLTGCAQRTESGHYAANSSGVISDEFGSSSAPGDTGVGAAMNEGSERTEDIETDSGIVGANSERDSAVSESSPEEINTSNDLSASSSSVSITEAEAKRIALNHAKLSENEVSFTKVKLDHDNGSAEYEIEFTASGTKYEYEINAASGAVSEFSSKQINIQAGAPTNTSSVSITEAEAKRIALNHAKLSENEVSFTKVKLDYDNGSAEYEIEFTASGTKYEYEINAASGAVSEFSSKQINVQSSAPTNTSSVSITEAEAKRIALNHAKLSENEVTFTKVKLDYDDGSAEYEIEFTANGTKYEYKINAVSGTITKTEID